MDVYKIIHDQDKYNTEEFWNKLRRNKKSDDIFDVTNAQINETVNAKILTEEQGNELKSRKKAMTASIKLESLKRYPVQVPEQSAQQTYSDKYKNQMSDSKRKRKQNLLGTDLHRKKVNAQDIERAEAKYQNEKTKLLAKTLNKMQSFDPSMLGGRSIDDLMSDPEILDRAEFLEDNNANNIYNTNILFNRLDDPVWGFRPRFVKKFMELDLSADLSTDKAIAKDAERLEMVTSKARAMINLMDKHPEIKNNLFPGDREELEAKLDRAFALIDYYDMRKSIITDEVYRTHENSELSMRFEPMPADLAQQMDLLESARTQAGQSGEEAQNEQQLAQAEQRAEKYYKEQNLVRKIWDADQRASMMNKYAHRRVRDDNMIENWKLYHSSTENIKQKDAPENAAWENYVRHEYGKNDSDLYKGKPLPPPDPESFKVKYLNDHKKEGDPVFEAVTKKRNIAGTRDTVDELSREYGLRNWAGLNILSDKEFSTMMENLTAFNVNVDEKWSPSKIEELRGRQLDALRSYKKILSGEVEFLKQKYGCGLRLQNPFSLRDHRPELERDMGNGQTITSMFNIFRKYGIMDTNDPADLEMEATMYYLFNSFRAGTSEIGNERPKYQAEGILPSYADMMRRSAIGFLETTNNSSIDTAVIMRIKELEKELDGNPMVKWGLKPSYAPAPDEPDENES